MKNHRTRQTFLRCDSTIDIYHVTTLSFQTLAIVCLSVSNQYDGHPNNHVFQHLISSHLISYNRGMSLFCSSYQSVKNVRLPLVFRILFFIPLLE